MGGGKVTVAEERIILTIDDGYCQEKCSCFPIACSAECEHLDKPTFSYTRQEAIERMAKAIFVSERIHYQGSLNWEDYKESAKDMFWRKRAKAALNALLEGK